MNIGRRLERLEAEARPKGAGAGVRFVVIVPPKMSREEWARCYPPPGAFTLKLDNAGAFGGADDEPSGES